MNAATKPRRRWVADPDFDPGGLIRTIPANPDRDARGPFILAGVPGGEVRISNGWLPSTAVKLYRFQTLAQAAAAAAIIRRRARLSDDGYGWEVADVADRRPLRDIAGQLAALRSWARTIEPDIRAAMTGLGPGHYSMLDREGTLS